MVGGACSICSREFIAAQKPEDSIIEAVAYEGQNSNNLQSWSFDSYGISHALWAIDAQFLEQGIDFGPNVRKLPQTLKTIPPDDRFKGVRFTITDEVDAWLNHHK